MPDKKGGQGQGGQGQGRQNGGVRGGGEGQGWQVGQQIREGAEQVSGRLQEGFNTAREGVGRGYRRAEGTVARNPGQSVLISFGVGFGLGVALVSLFGREEHESWTERNVTKPIRDMHVADRVHHASDRVHDAAKHVPEHVHHLADAIVSRLPHSVRKFLG